MMAPPPTSDDNSCSKGLAHYMCALSLVSVFGISFLLTYDSNNDGMSVLAWDFFSTSSGYCYATITIYAALYVTACFVMYRVHKRNGMFDESFGIYVGVMVFVMVAVSALMGVANMGLWNYHYVTNGTPIHNVAANASVADMEGYTLFYFKETVYANEDYGECNTVRTYDTSTKKWTTKYYCVSPMMDSSDSSSNTATFWAYKSATGSQSDLPDCNSGECIGIRTTVSSNYDEAVEESEQNHDVVATTDWIYVSVTSDLDGTVATYLLQFKVCFGVSLGLTVVALLVLILGGVIAVNSKESKQEDYSEFNDDGANDTAKDSGTSAA
uniref:Uncharacterized protein n=1 Tax=Heterosigma akashiwo TaxID=2829 RepID=A0A6V1SC08_HETAK|mmetsp:Transcript_58667/g.85807  ORF Transcript_58667/g.85807 Transcript_58667/m.85807 type:complete len:326 (+) Transcript_58667:65-1042(+)